MKGTKFKPNHNVIKGILLVFVLLCSLGVSAQTTFTIGNLEYTTHFRIFCLIKNK